MKYVRSDYLENNKKVNLYWLVLIPVVLAVLIGGASWFLAVSLRNEVSDTLSPLRDTNNRISTQIANLLHPTPTIIPDPVTIIREVQSLARLETIQYTVEKVITAEVNQGIFGPLFGDRLLFVAHGYVIAGIDLAQISNEDLWLKDGVLHARLPQAEVFVATLNNDQSYVYDRDTGILKKANVNLETLARQAAEDEILKAALADGILQQAQQNGKAYLERLFISLGYVHVIFE